ncbi:MAG: hypothetical protein NVSMB9_24360 [Isosphaeraceae bacterium]
MGHRGIRTRLATALSLLLLILSRALADDAPARPALTVRACRPEEQGERLLALFQGARAPHPAAALAGWKRATRGRSSLGKGREALIAALNPAMVRELRGFHDAEISFSFVPPAGRLRWEAVFPNDDGTVDALATALGLTDGRVEEPLRGLPVLRLGPPGSALFSGKALASTREGLEAALDRNARSPRKEDSSPSGWYAHLDPRGLRGLSFLSGRRLAEALDAVGCRETSAWLGLADRTFAVDITTQLEPRPVALKSIEPGWLNAVPSERVLAAVSFTVDTRNESLDAAFALWDRCEKVDPTRAGVAPIRTRLNLLAAVARFRPEVDFWPSLRGITGALLTDEEGEIDGALVVLHMTEDASKRLGTEVLPRLSAASVRAREDHAHPTLPCSLGQVAGKPVTWGTRPWVLLFGWGARALPAAFDAWDHPEQSAASAIRASWNGSAPQRVGAFWPGRLRTVAVPGSPLARALDGSPPVLWTGHFRDRKAVDVVRWKNLAELVRRWLDALPLELSIDR